MDQQFNRRVFNLRFVASAFGASASALVAGVPAFAQEGEKVTEADPYAKSMGFRVETANVDKVKYPRHDITQHCSECQLFSGKPGEAVGPCSFYGGRLVPINGWCRNFKVKKAKA